MICCFGATEDLAREVARAAQAAGFLSWTCWTSEQVREAFRGHSKPTVVIANAGGDEHLLRDLVQFARVIPVLACVDPDDIPEAVRIAKLGVAAALPLPLDPAYIHRLLRDLDGQRVAVPLVSQEAFPSLTLRELQVFDLLVQGSTNKEAAKALGISPRTIEVHRARIMEKTGARNVAELVRVAYSHRGAA